MTAEAMLYPLIMILLLVPIVTVIVTVAAVIKLLWTWFMRGVDT